MEQRRGLNRHGRYCPTCRGRYMLWLYGSVYLECPTCFDPKVCGTCGGRRQIRRSDGVVFDCPDCEAQGVLPKPKTIVVFGRRYWPHPRRVAVPAPTSSPAVLLKEAV